MGLAGLVTAVVSYPVGAWGQTGATDAAPATAPANTGTASPAGDTRASTPPQWLPFRGSTLLGCVLTNCNGSGHGDWALDIPLVRNAPVYATGSGTVLGLEDDEGGNCDQSVYPTLDHCPPGRKGNVVLIDHGGGVYSLYGHLGEVMVSLGQRVTEGTVLGAASDSGWAPPGFVHLHYEEWNGLPWAGGKRTEPRDLKACHGTHTVTYPDTAGAGRWNSLPGFQTTLRHDGGCNPNGPTCITGFIDVLGGHPFCEEIDWLVERQITEGFGDSYFLPTRSTSRQAAVAWLYRHMGSPKGPFPDPNFPDVDLSNPFYTAIAWGVEVGLVTGFDDGTFRPTRDVSRQAFVAWLYRLAGEPPVTGEPGFRDVEDDDPFVVEITWAVDHGITTGYEDGTFGGHRDVTRQATAAFLERYAT